ncbi:hypothetical protein A2U01_0047064, partial [Trifolium medium]|nr:hypothetical protein [Trifolium medium]
MEQNQDSTNELCVRKYHEARENLSKVLKQEEDYWKQRAKTHWLRDGDANTKFFHAIASTRKKKNSITKLSNAEGDMIQEQSEEDNHNLTKEFMFEEFKEAVFSMHSDKAPGPDGMNPAFY